MKERKHYLYLSNLETNIVLLSLIELRNSLINEGRYPDCVNDIIGGLLKIEFAFEVAPKPEV